MGFLTSRDIMELRSVGVRLASVDLVGEKPSLEWCVVCNYPMSIDGSADGITCGHSMCRQELVKFFEEVAKTSDEIMNEQPSVIGALEAERERLEEWGFLEESFEDLGKVLGEQGIDVVEESDSHTKLLAAAISFIRESDLSENDDEMSRLINEAVEAAEEIRQSLELVFPGSARMGAIIGLLSDVTRLQLLLNELESKVKS